MKDEGLQVPTSEDAVSAAQQAEVAENVSAEDVEQSLDVKEENSVAADATQDDSKSFVKETFWELVRSLITGVFPTATDMIFSSLVFFLFFAKGAGYSFFDTLFEDIEFPAIITTVGGAVGYALGSVVTYICSVLFVFKHTDKSKTPKGVATFVGIEVFAFFFNTFLSWLFNLFLISSLAFVARIVVSYLVVFTIRKVLLFMPEKNPTNTAATINEASIDDDAEKDND